MRNQLRRAVSLGMYIYNMFKPGQA